MLDRGVIGRRSEPVVNEVEKGAVQRFAEALGIDDPVHFDDRAAVEAGYRGIVAPFTFPVTFRFAIDLREALHLGERGLIPADQSLELFRPICVGDRIHVVGVVADVVQRMGQNGPAEVVVVEDEGRDDHGTLVYRGRRSWIVRPAPQEA